MPPQCFAARILAGDFGSRVFKQNIQIFIRFSYLRSVTQDEISAQFVEVALRGCELTLASIGISSSFHNAVGNVVVLSRLSHRLGISSYHAKCSRRCSYIEKWSEEAAN